MSPEQASGQRNKIGQQSDIYSLGAVLYYLLTGTPPFRGETTLQTLQMVMEMDPTPLRQMNPRIPADLETICLKALEKAPSKRYQDGEALAEDLRRYLEHEPIKARPVSLSAKLGRWCRRKPALAAVAALVLTIAVGSPIAAYQLNRARLVAEQGELAARFNAYAADMALIQESVQNRNFRYALTQLRRHIPKPDQLDIRGWEWRYFWSLCQGDEVRTLTHHQGREVYELAISPNGKWVVSRDGAGGLKLCQVAADQETLLLRNSRGPLPTFSPRSDRLALITEEGEISLVNLPSLEKQSFSIQFPDDLERLLLLDDHRMMGLAGEILRTWDLQTLQEIQSHRVPQHIRSVASPDGQTWVLTDDKDIMLFDVNEGVRWRSEPGHNAGSTQRIELALSPDKKLVAAGIALLNGGGFALQLWDAKTGRLKTWVPAHSAWINHVAFSPDGQFLATTSNDQSLHIRSVKTLRTISELKGHNAATFGASFVPDVQQVISSGGDGTVKLWNFGPMIGSQATVNFGETMTSDRLSSDNSSVIIGLKSHVLNISTKPLRVVERTEFPFPHTSTIAGGPNGKTLALISSNGLIRLWDVEAKNIITEIASDPVPFEGLALSPDGTVLAGIVQDKSVRIWSTSDGTELPLWRNKIGDATTHVFSLDSKLLGIGHGNRPGNAPSGKLTIWRVSDGQLILSVSTLKPVNQLTFSRDNRLLAATTQDATARVWEIPGGRQVAEFSGGHSSLYCVSFSPDATRLFVNEWDEAYLFDLRSKRQVAHLQSLRPIFLDADTVLGLSREKAWVWKSPTLAEIDATLSAH